jgi:hypothetical protein
VYVCERERERERREMKLPKIKNNEKAEKN